MVMPLNYILVRHGFSAGNRAVNRAKNGDNSLFTEKYVMTPGNLWRLESEGILQAKVMGEWLNKALVEIGGIDRFYVSPYIRTKQTAGYLNLDNAEWRVNRAYREREWGEIEALPRREFEEQYPNSARVKKLNPLYWAPPGGESIAEVAENRVRNILDTLHRECSNQNVLAVTHGENMWAHQLVLQRWSDEEFKHNDSDPKQRIENCQVLWYQKSSDSNKLNTLLVATPVKDEDSGDWIVKVTRERHVFNFPKYTNQELLTSTDYAPYIFND